MAGTNDDTGAGHLDPRDAARLLGRADRAARRQLDLAPPVSALAGGVAVLVGYGALWLSVRDQRPYTGPSLGALAVLYGVLAVAVAVTGALYQRARAGVSGRTGAQRTAEAAALLLSVAATPVLEGALGHYGAGDSLVYGVVPAAAPLIFIGSTVMGIGAGQNDRRRFGSALVVVIGGMVALWVGPRAAWAVAGVGLLVGVFVYGVSGLGRRRGDG